MYGNVMSRQYFSHANPQPDLLSSFSFCFVSEQGPSKYIVVQTLKNWGKARLYCRANYTDLVSVRNMSENEEISKLMTSASWIGLHRHRWARWSDKTPRAFTKWNRGQPDNNGDTMASCVAVSTTTGTWWDVDCKAKHHFVCQNVSYPLPRAQHRTMLKFQSEADLNDPAAQQQILEQVQ